jgi:Flp pilus assembly protein TadG
MRMISERLRSPAPNQERGATLVFVAIALVVLCGVAALTIDLGNGWVTRRNLVTSTDAAALAAAQEYGAGGNGCDTIDETYVLLNNPSATGITCTPGGSPSAGWVTVYAEDNVETRFAPVIGRGDFLANSSSTARWGALSGAPSGLRPIAMCVEAVMDDDTPDDPTDDTTVRDWFDAGGVPNNKIATIRFSNPEGQPDLCNPDGSGNPSNVPGNWGLVDFDGVGGNDSQDWIENGYDGDVPVWAGTPGESCPDATAPDPENACYPPQTGELTQAKQQIEDLVGVPDVIVPIIDYSVDAGGSNTEFHIIGFASVIFRDVLLTGPDSERFIQIQFVKIVTQGEIGGTGGPTNILVIQPCAIDDIDLSACQ